MNPDRPRRGLLDTSVLIDFDAAAIRAVIDEATTSAVCLAELHYGVDASSDPLERLRRRRRVDAITSTIRVLPFDEATAPFYGACATRVRELGRNPRPRRMDLQIAATALQHGLVLVTHNGGDFTGLETVLDIVDLSESAEDRTRHRPE